jgi:hypothetical protein
VSDTEILIVVGAMVLAFFFAAWVLSGGTSKRRYRRDQRVLKLLRISKRALSGFEIEEIMGMHCHVSLARLRDQGQIGWMNDRDGRAYYFAKGAPPYLGQP